MQSKNYILFSVSDSNLFFKVIVLLNITDLLHESEMIRSHPLKIFSVFFQIYIIFLDFFKPAANSN